MDRGLLAGQPDQGDDGEAAILLGVQDVLAVARRVALALGGGEQRVGPVGVGAQVRGEAFADQVGGEFRGQSAVHDGTDLADQGGHPLGEPVAADRGWGCHASRFGCTDLSRPTMVLKLPPTSAYESPR